MAGTPRLEREQRVEPSAKPARKSEPPGGNPVTLRPAWAWAIFAIIMLGIPTLALLRTCGSP